MNKKKIDWNDILGRVAKTFVQAFVGAVSIDALMGVTDPGSLKRIAAGLAIAGVSAGISAVWNLLQNLVAKWQEEEHV